jgi:hypothetical protein
MRLGGCGSGWKQGRYRPFVWTVCATYAALALAHNVLTPIGESPDENSHFEYLRIVAEERRLPGAADYLWQGHQAPLYYVLQAAWTRAIRAVSGCRVDPARLPNRPNPGFPRAHDFNWLVHGSTERVGAWGCTEWSFHLLRLLSTALTVPMILLTFAILRETAPEAPALWPVGGALAALLPSHVAISAMVNNDALVNVLIVATTYLVIRAVRTGAPADLATAIILATTAATAKLSGLYLFGLVLLVPTLRPDLRSRLFARGRPRAWLAAAASIVLPLALLARNVREWNDPFGVSALEQNLSRLTAAGAHPPSRGFLYYYTAELPALVADGLLVAYGAVNFGLAGPFEVARWGPRLIGAGLVLALLIPAAWRQVRRVPLLVLVTGFTLFFLTYVYPGYRYRWLQVRYFFHQLPLISLVAAVGMLPWWRGVQWLGVRLPDAALAGLVYAALVALNLLVLAKGVVAHLYRYIGVGG